MIFLITVIQVISKVSNLFQLQMSIFLETDKLQSFVSQIINRKDIKGNLFVTKCSVINRRTGLSALPPSNSTHSFVEREMTTIDDAFKSKAWDDVNLKVTVNGEKVVFLRELDDQTEIHAKIVSDEKKSLGLGCTTNFLALVECSDLKQSHNAYATCSILLKMLNSLEEKYR